MLPCVHVLNTCVISLVANEEYYQLLMSSESQPCSMDVPSYTMEQVEGITSEYIVKNAVSDLTGHEFSLNKIKSQSW